MTAYSSFSDSMLQHMQTSTVETLQQIAAAAAAAARRHHNDNNDNTSMTVEQILLQWTMQHNMAIIPGMDHPQDMANTLKLYDSTMVQPLSDQEMKDIDALRTDELAKEFFVIQPDET